MEHHKHYTPKMILKTWQDILCYHEIAMRANPWPAVNIKIESEDGTSSLLECKDRVKYLAVHLDDTVSFKHHVSYFASQISRSNGIIAKLRHFLTLSQLRQLYYSIIYPYISYAILAWGSAYKTHIKKIQTKQNHAIRLIFFARTLGELTESALPLLNLSMS